MIRNRPLFIVALVVIGLLVSAGLVASCGGPGPAASPTEAPAPAVEPTETPAPTAEPVEEAEAAEEAEEAEAVEEAEVVEEAAPPTEEPEAEEEPAAVAPGTHDRVDMDAIFPPGPGRELTLMGCTGCHNWVPLVIVGFNEEEWDRNARHHRDFVSSMSDEDFETVYDYLKEHFGPDTPVPELPQVLLDEWTSY